MLERTPPGSDDEAFAGRVLTRMQLLAALVCGPAFLAAGISRAAHGPEALDVAGMLVFSTGMTGGGLTTLLVCWRPARWIPALRPVVNRCCLFGTIMAGIMLGLGLASSPIAGTSGPLSPVIGLAFLPATLMGIAGMTLLYVTSRLHPEATLSGKVKLYQQGVARRQAEEEERARINPYPTRLNDWLEDGDSR